MCKPITFLKKDYWPSSTREISLASLFSLRRIKREAVGLPWLFSIPLVVSDLFVSEEGSLLNGNMTYKLTAGFDIELQIQGR